MQITKTISTLSLALTMFGGALLIAPSQAEAGTKYINYGALKGNQGNKNTTRPGQPANKYNRGCSKINHCRG